MKKMKHLISALLVLTMMFSLCISASATKWGDPIVTKTLSTEYGTLKAEIWEYTNYENGNVYIEPTFRTSIDSKYTMVQTSVDVECQYNDTGKPQDSGWSGKVVERNQNYAENNFYLTNVRKQAIVAHSTHEVIYTEAKTLHLVTFL